MSITPGQVKLLRKRTGLTQIEAAKCVHVAYRTWQSWETFADSENSRQMLEGSLELFVSRTDKTILQNHKAN